MTRPAIVKTENWLAGWVIGKNLCPFAEHPYQRGKVRIVATTASTSDAVFSFILAELEALYNTPVNEVETTLVVVESFLESWEAYLDLLTLLEAVMPETGLEGIIQVASFHPQYVFAGVRNDDPSNYTNRSPFPMFHLIREHSLESALKNFPDPEKIPERNIAMLRDMGVEAVRQYLSAIGALE